MSIAAAATTSTTATAAATHVNSLSMFNGKVCILFFIRQQKLWLVKKSTACSIVKNKRLSSTP